jgi:hypothetical protein
MRNTNEGFHGYVKDEAQESLAKPQRRRLHGVAPQSVLTALCLMAANVRKVRTFLDQKAKQLVLPSARRPGVGGPLRCNTGARGQACRRPSRRRIHLRQLERVLIPS